MTNTTRYDAYCALRDLPDPADLPARTRRYIFAGDPHRRERLKRELELAWLRHRMAEHGEQAEIVSVRRSPRISSEGSERK